jgi:hypothetical protein
VSGERERVSDFEREQAALALRDDLVAGRLSLEEFSDRIGTAYEATFRGELAGLREDLPEHQSMPSRRSPPRLSAALFGHLVRRGRLRLRRRILEVHIHPGRVFDRTGTLDEVPDGYRAINDRDVLKFQIEF